MEAGWLSQPIVPGRGEMSSPENRVSQNKETAIISSNADFYFIYQMKRASEKYGAAVTTKGKPSRDVSDAYWAEKHKKKEALTVKEEDCFETRAAEHSNGASTDSPEKPKNRTSVWEEGREMFKESVMPLALLTVCPCSFCQALEPPHNLKQPVVA
ncbi:hypothetical protein Q5P01_017006 [Channa striata]|uniref:Uncharacterized protein n=1 Tax=Channa striata TaxID=64152 RepID=A0AA88MBF8_CHASR|nr:hypothetical protein Q5P01_017006 [Channa striata]